MRDEEEVGMADWKVRGGDTEEQRHFVVEANEKTRSESVSNFV